MATGARILGVFMMDAFSHFNINNAMMETLAAAGHEVTIISPLKPKNPLANITYIQARKKMPKHVSSWSQSDLKSMSLWQIHKLCQVIMEEGCELFMSLPATKVSVSTLVENLRNTKVPTQCCSAIKCGICHRELHGAFFQDFNKRQVQLIRSLKPKSAMKNRNQSNPSLKLS